MPFGYFSALSVTILCTSSRVLTFVSIYITFPPVIHNSSQIKLKYNTFREEGIKMSELQNKQRIYDLTSELEALKPKADSYKQMVTDIADTVAGYVETSNDPKEAYEVLRAVANIILDNLVINSDEWFRGGLDFSLYRMIGIAFMNMNITLSNKGTKFMSSEDKYSIYETEDSLYDYEDEDYSVFTTEVGDISEV